MATTIVTVGIHAVIDMIVGIEQQNVPTGKPSEKHAPMSFLAAAGRPDRETELAGIQFRSMRQ